MAFLFALVTLFTLEVILSREKYKENVPFYRESVPPSKGISKFSSKVGKWNHFFPMDLDILAKSQVQNYNIRSELDIFGQILKFKTIT